jgi:hypothetical protein
MTASGETFWRFCPVPYSQHCQCKCASPKPCHYAAAKHVLRYLKGTRSHCLHYGGALAHRHLPLSGLSDADWAGDKQDRASVFGFVWSLGGGPISWSAKKQNCIALSTTEAEYIALTKGLARVTLGFSRATRTPTPAYLYPRVRVYSSRVRVFQSLT